MSKLAMKFLLVLVGLVLAGCSTLPKQSAPNFSSTEAHLEAASIVANPEAKKHIALAQAQLKSAEGACLAISANVDRAILERNEAIEKAEYWKAKQRKALGELWMWRGALIAVGLFALRGPIMWLVRKFIGIPW